MNYRFADKVVRSQNSLIRDIAAKGRQIPGFISFAMGNPASESIPVELLQECVREVFTEDPMGVFQYGPMVGEASLSEWVKKRVVTVKGCSDTGNSVVLLAGSGKALGLVPRTLCSEGDEAYCDEFTFPNAFNSIRNVGAKAIGIAMDDDGMIPEALEEKAKCGKGKYIYLIPNFQNPTGMTVPLNRRKELYEVARKYDLIIYEDDPYGEIRFAGNDIPSLKSMDEDGRVIYVGSFSKTLSAGLRVGYLYAADELAAKIASVKSADGQDPVYNQRIVMKALEKMDYEEHLRKISAIYGRKCNLMAEGLKKYCSENCRVLVPEGGMFIWVKVPEDVDINAFSDAVLKAGVGAVKSMAFAANADNEGHAFRLNFSASPDEDIEKGVKIFGEISKQFCR